jgi:hypothetical protein
MSISASADRWLPADRLVRVWAAASVGLVLATAVVGVVRRTGSPHALSLWVLDLVLAVTLCAVVLVVALLVRTTWSYLRTAPDGVTLADLLDHLRQPTAVGVAVLRPRSVHVHVHRADDGDTDMTDEEMAGQAPRLVNVTVHSRVTAIGIPVRVTWAFDHAREVVVDGVGGHPPNGSTDVYLDRSRAIEVMARNAVSVCKVATPSIALLVGPSIGSVQLPAAPHLRLTADVGAAVHGSPRASVSLDLLNRRHERRRAGPAPDLRGLLRPTALVLRLRTHPLARRAVDDHALPPRAQTPVRARAQDRTEVTP